MWLLLSSVSKTRLQGTDELRRIVLIMIVKFRDATGYITEMQIKTCATLSVQIHSQRKIITFFRAGGTMDLQLLSTDFVGMWNSTSLHWYHCAHTDHVRLDASQISPLRAPPR